MYVLARKMKIYTDFVASLPVTLERACIGLVLYQFHDVHYDADCGSAEVEER